MVDKVLSNKLYYATFALALFVIALHSSYLELLNPNLAGYEFAYSIQRFLLVLGEAAVPTFFVVSGYLLFTKFTLKGYPKMLLSKVFSLVIPYFVWSAGALLVMEIILPLCQGKTISLTFQSVVVDLLLAKEYPHLWFVQPLLVYSVCSPLLYFVFKYLKKWSILIPIALFFVYMFFRPYYGGILLWIPYFFVGTYLSYFRLPLINRYRPKLFGWIFLMIFFALAALFTFTHAQYEDHAYYLYRFASPLLVWLSLDTLTRLFQKEKVRPIFKTSGFIFFSHLFLVNAIKLLLQMGIAPDSNYHCALLFFLVFVLSCFVVIGISYLLQRFAKPVYRFLGGR